ncbi:MAG: YdcF family protein [Bacteroidota bacterium]|nr:YdcF family protein [Bacteroidota bacterium]
MPVERTVRRCVPLFVSAIAVFLAIGMGDMLSEEGDASSPADVAVVPGGDAGPRTIAAAGLYRSGRVHTVLLMGYTGGMMRRDEYISQWQTDWLTERGVPLSAIRYDSTARTTWEEAEAVRRFLEKSGATRALVVIDPPYVRRLRLTYTCVFSGSQCSFRIFRVPSLWWRPEKWWATKAGTNAVFHEIVKLMFYSIRVFTLSVRGGCSAETGEGNPHPPTHGPGRVEHVSTNGRATHTLLSHPC